MRSVVAGTVCVVWLIHAAWPSAADAQIFRKPEPPPPAPAVPWDELNEKTAAIIKPLLEKPTVAAKGPAETFACMPEQYYWLLDNPDRAVIAWRRLGAKCVSIQKRGPGKFGYVDEHGSDISWDLIHQSATTRIWLAEGKVKPSPVLPLVPMKALVILHHSDGKTADGTIVVQHQAEVIVHTDSKAVNAVAKMMGQSAPKVAEQGLAQASLFFSALSSFLDRHPDRAEALFRPEGAAAQPTKKAGN